MSIVVVTCDLIQSKDLSKRSEIQEKLKETIKIVNKEYSKDILCPFIIIWGDSFQGALKSFKGLYKIQEIFEENISTEFRCGIGIGEISTKISSTTLDMDGQAFHRSKDALKIAEKNQWRIYILSGNEPFDDMMNTIFILLYEIKTNWTEKQKGVIKLRRKGWTYEKIGAEKGISKQSVHKILKAAHWKSASEAKRTLDNITTPNFFNYLEDDS
jgi:hypothetical protein